MAGLLIVLCSLGGEFLKRNYLIADEIVFDAKPTAVPYNYRISYKISQLLMILSMCCSRGGCSLIKLNMISMAMCTPKESTLLIEIVNDKITVPPVIRFDPAVNRAVLYAVSDGLMSQQKDGKLKLTLKGKLLVNSIQNESNLMYHEKIFLSKLSTKLTEEKIKMIMENWRYSHATD